MKLSLAQKVCGFVLLPMTAFAVFSFISMRQSLHERYQAKAIRQNTDFFLATSAFIHEAQKERGKSAMYLAGKLGGSELESQRQAVDQKLAVFVESSKLVDFNADARARSEAVIQAVQSVRREVNEKGNPPSVAAQYTGIILKLVGLQVDVTKLARLDGIETRLLSLTTLEMAKESAGRLRASVTNILGADKELAPGQQSQIEGFKAGVEANVNSPTLLVSSEGRSELDRFKTSDDWKKVISVYEVVNRRASQGRYGEDPGVFFSAITRAIDKLGSIVALELGPVAKAASEVESNANSRFWIVLAAVLAVSGVLIALTWRFVRSLSRSLEKISGDLTQRADGIASAATQISAATQQLTASATEQAAAIQETATSVDEVNSMVAKNAENASKSRAVSETSNVVAQKGKEAVDEVISSIGEINRSNSEIIRQIELSNQEISEIVKVITEIGNKTKVINDIVFQTKLLSFNASVEAARAGEHGKGFAVVAEEVGNLAQMSGNAAKEISQMLEGSIQKVERIVNDTRSRVEQLVRVGKEKVEAGTVTAKRCGDVLDELVRNVSEVARMFSEITTASQEQSRGVQEISKAMGQMDQVTQQNTSASQQSADAAEALASQAEGLRSSAVLLLETVRGEADSHGEPTAKTGVPTSGSGKVVPIRPKKRPGSIAGGHAEVVRGARAVPDESDPRFKEV